MKLILTLFVAAVFSGAIGRDSKCAQPASATAAANAGQNLICNRDTSAAYFLSGP